MSSYIYDIVLLILDDARLNQELVYWIANIICVIATMLFFAFIIGFPFWLFYNGYKLIFRQFMEKDYKKSIKKRLKK